MADEADLVRCDLVGGHQGGDPVGDGPGGIGRGGRQLEVVQRAGAGVVQGEIGEGSADVEADAIHLGPGFAWPEYGAAGAGGKPGASG